MPFAAVVAATIDVEIAGGVGEVRPVPVAEVVGTDVEVIPIGVTVAEAFPPEVPVAVAVGTVAEIAGGVGAVWPVPIPEVEGTDVEVIPIGVGEVRPAAEVAATTIETETGGGVGGVVPVPVPDVVGTDVEVSAIGVGVALPAPPPVPVAVVAGVVAEIEGGVGDVRPVPVAEVVGIETDVSAIGVGVGEAFPLLVPVAVVVGRNAVRESGVPGGALASPRPSGCGRTAVDNETGSGWVSAVELVDVAGILTEIVGGVGLVVAEAANVASMIVAEIETGDGVVDAFPPVGGRTRTRVLAEIAAI